MKQQYDSYKPSSIDWIRDIPSHWKIVRIKNIISLLTDYDANGSFSDIASNCKINEGIPYAWMVRATDLENKRYGIVEGNNYCDIGTYTYLSKSSLVKDDILIAKRGDIGKSYLVPNCDSPMTLAPNTYLLKTLKNLINNHYFFYYLQSSSGKENLRLENKSTTLGALYKDDVKRIPIPLPPLAEQEAIASWLDKKCGEIDAAIAKVDREIELIDELKQSEISRVVTRGLNPDAPLRPSGIDWIGNIPSHWEIAPVKYSFNLFAGATPKTEKAIYWDGEIIWITPADYKTDDHYISKGRKNITKEGLASCATEIVPINSLIFSKRAPIGTVSLAKTPLCTNQGCISCVPKSATNSNFFYYSCRIATKEFEMLGSGATFLEISSSNFANFKMPLPPLTEQQAIADYLDKKCAEIDGLKAKLSKKRETLTELRQSIISEVVTGKRKVI